jgi:hypothetical protein
VVSARRVTTTTDVVLRRAGWSRRKGGWSRLAACVQVGRLDDLVMLTLLVLPVPRERCHPSQEGPPGGNRCDSVMPSMCIVEQA